MSIDAEQLEKLSALAGLELDPELAQSLVADFARILDMIERMHSVDVEGVAPLMHPLELTQPLRPDEVDQPLAAQTLMEAAPETREGFFVVPRVVD